MELSPATLIALKLLAVLALVACNGFFVAAEFALVKIRETQLEALIAQGSRRAQLVRGIVRNLDASLSACQLGVTLASLALGWVGEPVFKSLLEPLMNWLAIESMAVRETLAVVVGMSAITFLHITAGEQAPKWLAIQKPVPVGLWAAHPLDWFHRATYPFIWLVNHASLWMLRQLGVQMGGEHEVAHSEDELRLLFAASQKHDATSALGRAIVLNALDLRHRQAREVMRPRQEMVGLSTEAPLLECLDLAEKTRYSRFPLCEDGNLDRTVGIIHIKDLYAARHKAARGADLLPHARKIIFVPETARLDRLLQRLLERKLHFAIVVDEYGGTLGMVTLENILEALVGQIQDEFDQETPLAVQTNESTWEIAGALPLHALAELVGEPVHEEDVTTTSGLVTHRFGGFPKAGDAITFGRFRLRVVSMDGLLVHKLVLTRLPAEDVPPKDK